MERDINVRGKSSEQESNCTVSAVCRGEGTKNTSKDDGQQSQVSQPIQVTSHNWEGPVIAHGDLVHYPSAIVEQVRTCTLVVCLHINTIIVYMYIAYVYMYTHIVYAMPLVQVVCMFIYELVRERGREREEEVKGKQEGGKEGRWGEGEREEGNAIMFNNYSARGRRIKSRTTLLSIPSSRATRGKRLK